MASTPGRIEGRGSERRSAIVEATTRLFLGNGFAGTSMREIARACGIREATLYHHFPGKDALSAACVTHGYASALATLQAIRRDPEATPGQKMRRALAAL